MEYTADHSRANLTLEQSGVIAEQITAELVELVGEELTAAEKAMIMEVAATPEMMEAAQKAINMGLAIN